MNVLYIGGTGTISSACVEASVTAGHCVTVLNRGNRPLPAGVEQVIGDKEDEAVLRQLAGRGFDVVCQFLGYTPEQADRDIEIFAGQCGQYVFVSSASVYAKPSHHAILTEACPIASAPEHALWKCRPKCKYFCWRECSKACFWNIAKVSKAGSRR